jgi:hypothetical protein
MSALHADEFAFPSPGPVRRSYGAAIFDFDETLTRTTGKHDDLHFASVMVPRLVELALRSTEIVVNSGNSFESLATRFLRPVAHYVASTVKQPALLAHFAIVANTGTMIASFAAAKPELERMRSDASGEEVLDVITEAFADGVRSVRPVFVDRAWTKQAAIELDAVASIVDIARGCAREYLERLDRDIDRYCAAYDLGAVSAGGTIRAPVVQLRTVPGAFAVPPVLQVTLKPFLSAAAARSDAARSLPDPRSYVVKEIRAGLRRAGLTGFNVYEAGKTSVDITSATIDKAAACEFLLKRLGLAGRGADFGASFYCGDDFRPGGNDESLARVKGLTIIDVGGCSPVPPGVLSVPAPLRGPEAACFVIGRVIRLISALASWSPAASASHRLALAVLRAELQDASTGVSSSFAFAPGAADVSSVSWSCAERGAA